MRDDKKKMSSLIIAKMSGKPEVAPQSEDGAEVDDSVALKTAGEEFIAAIESKSPMAVVEALKSLMELCEMPEEDKAEENIEEKTEEQP